MKAKLFLLIFLALISKISLCQECFPDGIEFLDQVAIDNFKSNYPGCTKIGGDVLIKSSLGKITNLNGLSNLTSIKGGLFVVFNDLLSGFEGMNNLTSVGDLTIAYNREVTNFSGLDNLAYVGGWFGILYNISLIDFSGLNHLTTIVGGLQIDSNDSLTSLNGLDKVTSIGEDLIVQYNMALKNLTGLSSLDSGSISNLVIKLNYSLSKCEVESVCNYIANSTGKVEILNNSTGCNSLEEVETACGIVSVDKPGFKEGFTLNPNPSSSHVTVNTPVSFLNSDLFIFSYAGQQMIRSRITGPRMVIDITDLPKGVYFVRINNVKAVSLCKLVKK